MAKQPTDDFPYAAFFSVSGILSASAIRSLTLPQLFWRRIALLVYIYAVWCLVRAAWFLVVPWPFDPRVSPVGDVLTALVVPWSGLWFVYALALYLTVAWVLRHLPWWGQLAITGAISLAFGSGLVRIGASYTWGSIGTYLIFFMIGALASNQIRARAASLRWWEFGVVAVVFVGALAVLPNLPIQSTARFLVSFLGAAFGIYLSVMVSRIPTLGNAATWLGVRTLPLYVTHSLTIAAICWVLPSGALPGGVAIVAIAATAVLISWSIVRVIGRVSGVFTLPGWLDRQAAARNGASAR